MLHVVAGVGAFVLALMLAVALGDLIRRPAFRRLALRNLLRRRTETILVVLGSSLGTAIIASAFVVGATFHASVRDGARTKLGPIDEQVALPRVSDVPAVVERLRNPPITGTDGVLGSVRAAAALTATVSGRQVVEPSATVGEYDLSQARRFGGHPEDTGLAAAPRTLGPSDVLINRWLADQLGVAAGDRVTLHAFGTERTFRIAQVLEPVGLAGATDVIVRPGTLEAMTVGSSAQGATPPRGEVLVSNVGRVLDSASSSDAVTAAITRRLPRRFGAEVTEAKSDLLAEADAQGQSAGQLFTGIGTFSVLAGVLLLVNLFVMLAEERKRELGLARATGLRRWHLVRVFTLEGACYGVAAAFVGTLVGTGLAWLVARSAAGLVGGDDRTFHLHFVEPIGVLVTAGLIGLGLSMATVWITSLRIANLNIVRALRDLPDLVHRRHRLRSSGPAAMGVGLGIALTLWGVVSIVPLAAVLGPPIGLFAAVALLRPHLGRRVATAVASIGTLVWCIGVFTFLGRITDHSGVPVFVIQGLVMVAAAVALSTALDRVWAIAVAALGRTGRGLAGRLGLAYPLEKVFRTGLLVGMYALIVFTLVFLAVYGKISSSQIGSISHRVAAGADLLVDSNPTDPVPQARLVTNPGVARVARLWQAAPLFTTPEATKSERWPVTGFESSLLALGVPHLVARSSAYRSDRAAFRAMLRDPRLIVVDQHFLHDAGLSTGGGGAAVVGSTIRAHDPDSGKSATYRVIGLTSDDVTHAGAWVAAGALRSLATVSAVPSRFRVQVTPGANPDQVAVGLESEFLANGVTATTFRAKVASAMSVRLGFFALMQRYLGIGLVVGIFGLAVVMVRASRSRRRQIGMLRTIGFSADTVRHAFLIEAAFIAFQGIATGVGLGLLVSYQMLSKAAALGGEPLPYSVPWSTIGALAAIPFAASLAVAMIPASQASSVNPARVLRMAE